MIVVSYSRMLPVSTIACENAFTKQRTKSLLSLTQTKVLEIGSQDCFDILGFYGRYEGSSQHRDLKRVDVELTIPFQCREQDPSRLGVDFLILVRMITYNSFRLRKCKWLLTSMCLDERPIIEICFYLVQDNIEQRRREREQRI